MRTPWHIYEPMMTEEIADLEQCLAGNSASKRWKSLQMELTKKKGEFLTQRQLYFVPGPAERKTA